MVEHTTIIQGACTDVSELVRNGIPRGKAYKIASKKRHGRHYKADRKRKIRLSPSCLRAYFSAWRKLGDRAFALNYRRSVQASAITEGHLDQFVGLCLAPRCTSMRAAFQQLPDPPRKLVTYLRRLALEKKTTIVRLHRRRRVLRDAERAAILLQKAA